MQRKLRPLFFLTLSSFAFCSYVSQKDEHYFNYFLHREAAQLFHTKQFSLTKAKAVYGCDTIDKVYLSFSCFRMLGVKEARRLLLETVNEILDAINNDPLLIEKRMLRGGHFCVKDLYIEITSENIFSKDCDNSTAMKHTCMKNAEITYTSYDSSPFYSYGVKEYKEPYSEAVLLNERDKGNIASVEIVASLKNKLASVRAAKEKLRRDLARRALPPQKFDLEYFSVLTGGKKRFEPAATIFQTLSSISPVLPPVEVAPKAIEIEEFVPNQLVETAPEVLPVVVPEMAPVGTPELAPQENLQKELPAPMPQEAPAIQLPEALPEMPAELPLEAPVEHVEETLPEEPTKVPAELQAPVSAPIEEVTPVEEQPIDTPQELLLPVQAEPAAPVEQPAIEAEPAVEVPIQEVPVQEVPLEEVPVQVEQKPEAILPEPAPLPVLELPAEVPLPETPAPAENLPEVVAPVQTVEKTPVEEAPVEVAPQEAPVPAEPQHEALPVAAPEPAQEEVPPQKSKEERRGFFKRLGSFWKSKQPQEVVSEPVIEAQPESVPEATPVVEEAPQEEPAAPAPVVEEAPKVEKKGFFKRITSFFSRTPAEPKAESAPAPAVEEAPKAEKKGFFKRIASFFKRKPKEPSVPAPEMAPQPASDVIPEDEKFLQEESPVQETPVQEMPEQEPSIQEAPIQEVPIQEVPIQEAPAQEIPVQPVDTTPDEAHIEHEHMQQMEDKVEGLFPTK